MTIQTNCGRGSLFDSNVAVVFAGGQSRRMGQNKLLLPRHLGAPEMVLMHVIRVASEISKTVVVLTPPAPEYPFQTMIEAFPQVYWIRDDLAYEGPLQALGHAFSQGRVLSGLLGLADCIWTFVPGDLPGIDQRVLNTCSQRLQQSFDMDAALVVREQRFQPLLGCYRGRALEKIVTRANQGERRFMPVVDALKVATVKQEDYLWPEWWTRPIHTPEDYQQWCEWIELSKRTLDDSL